MGFNREIDTKEWHKIGDKLTTGNMNVAHRSPFLE